MSALYMRMQPCETKPPIESGRLVPWMAYSPPRKVSAAAPIGLWVEPPGMTRGSFGFSRRMEAGGAQAGRTNLPSTRAFPVQVMPALPTPTGKRRAWPLVEDIIKTALVGLYDDGAG